MTGRRRRARWPVAAALLALALASCSGFAGPGGTSGPTAPATSPAAQATATPTASPTPTPRAAIPGWDKAVRTLDGGLIGVVQVPTLNIRQAPHLDAPVVGQTYQRHTITVYQAVPGDKVDGNGTWYRVGDGRYVTAAYVGPFVAPKPPKTYSGHWVDVTLSQFYAVAYDGSRPVYATIIAAGRENRTPRGVFHVFRRVPDETMDAATVGIPKGSPDYYYLTHVLYTQYFKEGGYALHYNYWTPPSQFGGFTTHGCVGLMRGDAEWFWNFLSIGSTVSIHD